MRKLIDIDPSSSRSCEHQMRGLKSSWRPTLMEAYNNTIVDGMAENMFADYLRCQGVAGAWVGKLQVWLDGSGR